MAIAYDPSIFASGRISGSARAALSEAAQRMEAGELDGSLAIGMKLLEQDHHPALLGEVNLIIGVACQRLGRKRESELFLNRCLEHVAEHPFALNTLGILAQERLHVQDALACYERAVAASPDFVECWSNLAGALRMLGRHTEARDAYHRVLSLRPDKVEAKTMLLDIALALGDWENWEQLTEELLASLRAGAVLPPFTSLLLPDATSEDAGSCAVRWARQEFGRIPEAIKRCSAIASPSPGGGRRLHIGYLSADFHNHATAYLLARVLELHDRSAFNITIYSYGPDDESQMRRRIEALPNFVELYGLSSQAAVQRILQDKVDILVDLKGYTTAARLEIVAARPAPVQVGWLGWPGSSGMSALDYVLVDETVCPAADWGYYSEIPYLLPVCYQPTDDTRTLLPPPSRESLGLPAEVFVLAGLHQTYKINPLVFDAWCAILLAHPKTVLWLLEPRDPAAAANLRKEAELRGVSPDRLFFAARASQIEHLSRLQSADLWLDTWPYGSHTTTSDALWAGLPVLGYCGNTFPARVSRSILKAAGLEDCVVTSPEEFIGFAGTLIDDPASMAELRKRVAAARQSALFDSEGFTRRLEHAFATIWQDAVRHRNRARVPHR